MKVAVKYGALWLNQIVDENGDLIVRSHGATLVARILKLFPGAQLIGRESRRCNGFDMVPLDLVDPENTLVINMDVLDSVGVFQILHRGGAEPKIMNFQWVNPNSYHHPVNFAAMGVAYAMFPTFCNSERTAGEVREVAAQWAAPRINRDIKVAWVNLGVHTERLQERRKTEIPVVLYPAIYLNDQKQWRTFVDIVDKARNRAEFIVDVRLHESHLISERAMFLTRKRYYKVGPLRATKEGYWEELSRTTAFLATAADESYGLEYVEGLLAGVIGIFPDRTWVRTILPEGYPFIYGTNAQAEDMLVRAVQEPDACRAEMDACVGGPFPEWVHSRHNDDDFEVKITEQITEWFGN